MPDESNSPTLVNVYIDGYNFYYSIRRPDEPELLPLGWCNFSTLADRLLKKVWPSARVGAVKYYTARVPQHLQLRRGEIERQQLWLNALKFGTKDRVRIVAGYYAPDNVKPRVEKQTDISLAIGMVRDSIMPSTDLRHDNFAARTNSRLATEPFSSARTRTSCQRRRWSPARERRWRYFVPSDTPTSNARITGTWSASTSPKKTYGAVDFQTASSETRAAPSRGLDTSI